MKTKMNGFMFLLIFIILAAALVLIILPPSLGKLPKASNTPDVISEKLTVEIANEKIGMILLGKDKSLPVLQVCGGGPGIPQYLVEYLYPSVLSDYFIVCYWDYPGTGLSFDSKIQPETVDLERYISATVGVTDYLRERFSKEQIYLMGHSFGTYVALHTVDKYPEKYNGYIAMSQTCDQKSSEQLAFDYMKSTYKSLGNKKMCDKFEQIDLSNPDDYEKYFYSGLRDKAMHELGVGTARNMHSVISDLFFPSLRCKTYTPGERINIWRGKAVSNKFALHSIEFNAFDSIQEIKVPIYFIIGKYDYTCFAELQEKYFDHIKAPVKEKYVFENSAHSPLYEEPDRARKVLNSILN